MPCSLRVEEGLADVKQGGCSCRQRTNQASCDDVRLWVVVPAGIDLLLQKLIGDEVDCLEGDAHGQLCGVTPVEGPQLHVPPHCQDTTEG